MLKCSIYIVLLEIVAASLASGPANQRSDPAPIRTGAIDDNYAENSKKDLISYQDLSSDSFFSDAEAQLLESQSEAADEYVQEQAFVEDPGYSEVDENDENVLEAASNLPSDEEATDQVPGDAGDDDGVIYSGYEGNKDPDDLSREMTQEFPAQEDVGDTDAWVVDPTELEKRSGVDEPTGKDDEEAEESEAGYNDGEEEEEEAGVQEENDESLSDQETFEYADEDDAPDAGVGAAADEDAGEEALSEESEEAEQESVQSEDQPQSSTYKRSSIIDSESYIVGADPDEVEDNNEDGRSNDNLPEYGFRSGEKSHNASSSGQLVFPEKSSSEYEGDSEDLAKFEFMGRNKRDDIAGAESDQDEAADSSEVDSYSAANKEEEEEEKEAEFDEPLVENVGEDPSYSQDDSGDDESKDRLSSEELDLNEENEDKSDDESGEAESDNNMKKDVIEYEDVHGSQLGDVDYEPFTADEDSDTSYGDYEPSNFFECNECFSGEESFEDDDADGLDAIDLYSNLTCPSVSTILDSNFDSFNKREIAKRSENADAGMEETSFAHEATREENTCSKDCEKLKRQFVAKPLLTSSLRTIRLWDRLDPAVKYHRIPRSSIGILADGNMFPYRFLIRSFALNLMLGFSRDSFPIVGEFAECMKLIYLPPSVMRRNWPSYRRNFMQLLYKPLLRGIKLMRRRNAAWALDELSAVVNEKGNTLKTPMKFIFLMLNGPISDSGVKQISLRIIRKKLVRSGIKLYIIQHGTNYRISQLRALTLPSRIFVVKKPHHLLFGGVVYSKKRRALRGLSHYSRFRGVLLELFKRMHMWANKYATKLGRVVHYNGGFVGWESDSMNKNMSRLFVPRAIFPDSIRPVGYNAVPDEIFTTGSVEKRQRISSRTGGVLKRPSLATGLYKYLRNNWEWFRRVPILGEEKMTPISRLVIFDVGVKYTMPILQKLIYHITTLSHVSVSPTTMVEVNGPMIRTVIRRKLFAHKEDFQRMIVTTSSKFGKPLTISQLLVRFTSPTARSFDERMPKAIYLILSHRSLDVQSFEYLAGVLRSRNIKVYIIGIGLSDQSSFFMKLTPSNRVFTCFVRRLCFTKSFITRLVRSNIRDFGSYSPVINLDRLSLAPRVSVPGRVSVSRPRGASRASRPRTRARAGSRSQRQTGGRRGKSWTTRAKSAGRTIGRRFGGGRGRGRGRGRRPGRYSQTRAGTRGSRSSSRGTSGRSGSKAVTRRAGGRQAGRRRAGRRVAAAGRRPAKGLSQAYRPRSGILGPVNMFFLVDPNLGRRLYSVRRFMENIINSYQRAGSYFWIAQCSNFCRFAANFAQFKNSGEVSGAVGRVKSYRSRNMPRNVGYALLEARRRLSTLNPSYVPIVFLITNGPSSDNYRDSSIELKMDGIKAIVLTLDSSTPTNEVTQIASSNTLSFTSSLTNPSDASTRIVKILREFSGRRNYPLSRDGRWSVTDQSLLKQWVWRTQNSGIKHRSVANSQLSFLLDITDYPDYVVKLVYNIMLLFGSSSKHSLRTLGSNRGAVGKLIPFRQYRDMATTMLALQSLTGNNVRAWLSRRRRRVPVKTRRVARPAGRLASQGFKRRSRSIISDLFSVKSKSRQEPGLVPATQSDNYNAVHGPSPRLQSAAAPKASPTGSLNRPVPATREIPVNTRASLVPAKQDKTSVANLREGKEDVPSSYDLPLTRPKSAASSSDLPRASLAKRPTNFNYRGYGEGMRRPIAGPGKRRRAGRLANLYRRPYSRRVAGLPVLVPKVYYGRTMANIAAHLNAIALTLVNDRSYWAFSPALNRGVFVILTGFPKHRRGGKRFSFRDRLFRSAANRITKSGTKLFFIVLKGRTGRDYYTLALLRSVSTAVIQGSWNGIQSLYHRIQTTGLKYFEKMVYPSHDSSRLRTTHMGLEQLAIIPTVSSVLPPAHDTFMTNKFLASISSLRRTPLWSTIVPGIRKRYINAFLNVVFVVDTTTGANSFVTRDLINNLFLLFNRRLTTFSMVSVGNSIKTVSINRRMRLSKNVRYGRGLTFSRMKSLPSLGAALSYVRRRVITRLATTRRNVVFVITRSKSRDDVEGPAFRLKNTGAVVSAIGIGKLVNIPELHSMASNGQLVAEGYESMMPVLVYRILAALSVVAHGPLTLRGPIYELTARRFRPRRTVYRSVDYYSRSRPFDDLQTNNVFTSKREEIATGAGGVRDLGTKLIENHQTPSGEFSKLTRPTTAQSVAVPVQG